MAELPPVRLPAVRDTEPPIDEEEVEALREADRERVINRIRELAALKAGHEVARKTLADFIAESGKAKSFNYTVDRQAHFEEQRFRLEALRMAHDVSLTDYLAAMNADAERRSESAERRHREDMKAAEAAALSRAEKSDEIQQAMTQATESMTKATWVFGGVGLLLVLAQIAIQVVQLLKSS